MVNKYCKLGTAPYLMLGITRIPVHR